MLISQVCNKLTSVSNVLPVTNVRTSLLVMVPIARVHTWTSNSHGGTVSYNHRGLKLLYLLPTRLFVARIHAHGLYSSTDFSGRKEYLRG